MNHERNQPSAEAAFAAEVQRQLPNYARPLSFGRAYSIATAVVKELIDAGHPASTLRDLANAMCTAALCGTGEQAEVVS